MLELGYLPPVSWMCLLWNTPQLKIEACEHFQKGSYRNRCHIAGPNGVQRLSIPLFKGKHQQTAIREVRIAYDTPWQRLHWRSILAAYGNAPYFEHYADGLAPFYHKNHTFLFDFNLLLLEFVLQKINYPGSLQFTETFEVPSSAVSNDYRNQLSPKQPTAAAWFQPAPYAQVFMERSGFLPDLSVLDLLFCYGKQSGKILEASFSQIS
ncbi:MAG: WbqC family protein [Saprospiraceae bacterium]|nr:WbqC family protein [Saprospiraceae bacterium]